LYPWDVAVPRAHAGVPVAALHQHRRVRDQHVAADMVEIEIRIDNNIDPRRVAADRCEPRSDPLARSKADREQGASPQPRPPSGSRRQSGWGPVSNRTRPLGVAIVMSPSPPSISRPNSAVTMPQVNAWRLTDKTDLPPFALAPPILLSFACSVRMALAFLVLGIPLLFN
jgi:hypothetical protein